MSPTSCHCSTPQRGGQYNIRQLCRQELLNIKQAIGDSETLWTSLLRHYNHLAREKRTRKDMLDKLTCLNCNHLGLVADREHGHPICPNCGEVFDSNQVVCPDCQTINPSHRQYCLECDAMLERKCSHCGESNWSGAAECVQCGRPLDLVDQVITRQTADFGRTLDDRRAQAAAIKAQTEASSQERLAALRAQEDEYMARIAAAKDRRDAEQKRFAQYFIAAVIGVAFCLLIAAIAYVVITS